MRLSKRIMESERRRLAERAKREDEETWVRYGRWPEPEKQRSVWAPPSKGNGGTLGGGRKW